MVDTRRKPNPYADVPRVPDDPVLTLEEMAGPGDAALELEIGFGKGRFILDRAEAHPDVRFLGLETRRKWVHLVCERAKKRALENVTILHGEARDVLSRTAGEAQLEAVYINFPDPWWKARHEKRMVLGPPLLADIARLLVNGGALFVQTDVDFRARAYKELLAATPELAPASGDGIVIRNPFDARSPREVRCMETGLPIYRLLFNRRER